MRFQIYICILVFAAALLGSCSSQPNKAPVSDRTQRSAPPPAAPPPPKAVAIPLSGVSADATYHKVIPGDTLHSIAWRYRQDYKEIARWNKLSPPYTIRVGQRLRVRPFPEELATPVRSSKPTVKSTPEPITAPSSASSETKTGSSGSPVWLWPAEGPLLKQAGGVTASSQGINIGGRYGEPVRAAAKGKVVYMGSGLASYGQLVIIKHSHNFLSAYAHNRRLLVREGDQVAAGQMIAEMGSSGTDRPMLHFEIRKDGTPVNPVRYLPKR